MGILCITTYLFAHATCYRAVLAEFVMIYMSDMLPFKADIESGVFKPSERSDTKSKASAKPKKKPVRRKTTSSDTHDETGSTGSGDPISAANDNIRNWRHSNASSTTHAHKDKLHKRVSQMTLNDTQARSASSRPKTGSKPKSAAAVRPKTGSRPKTGTRQNGLTKT